MARVYIRRGSDVKGSMYCNSDGKYIRIGDSRSDGIMYNIDGNYIREGDDSNGEIMLNIDGNYIRTGASKDGAIVYIIDGNYIRYGDYSDRRIAYNMTESSLGSGCFITTACIESRGLPVDCYELETLRKFRDNWVSKHENGPAEIGIYYEIAPKIVEKLDCLPNSKEIYEKIYQEVVLKCVRFIEEGKEEDAYLLYKNAICISLNRRLQHQHRQQAKLYLCPHPI